MDRDLQRILIQLAVDRGFDPTVEYLPQAEMTRLIPDFRTFAPDHMLDDTHGRALLQNLCLVITGTAATRNHPGSVKKQSTLKRWDYLRQVMPEAAEAYAAVLGYLGIPVPHCLR
ncbi:MAG: hypothetical protein ACKVT1_16995 [Dehalococcoidia bacterium]